MTFHKLTCIDTHTLTTSSPLPADLQQAAREDRPVELRIPGDAEPVVTRLRPAHTRQVYFPRGEGHRLAQRLGLLGASRRSPVVLEYRVAGSSTPQESERPAAQPASTSIPATPTPIPDGLPLVRPTARPDTGISIDVAGERRGQVGVISTLDDPSCPFAAVEYLHCRPMLDLPQTEKMRALVAAGDAAALAQLTWPAARRMIDAILPTVARHGRRRAWSIDAPSGWALASWRPGSMHGRATEKTLISGVNFQSSPRWGAGAEHGGDWGWQLIGKMLFHAALHDTNPEAWPASEQAWRDGLAGGFVDPWMLDEGPPVFESCPVATARHSLSRGGSLLIDLLLQALPHSEMPGVRLARSYLEGAAEKTDVSDALIGLSTLLPVTAWGRDRSIAGLLLLDPARISPVGEALGLIAHEGAIVVPWVAAGS